MNLLIAIDIDGTIADAGWRHILAGTEPNRKNWKKYKKWLKNVQSKKMLMKDKPVSGMKQFCHLVKKNAIYLTARQETYQDVTKAWLKANKFPNLKLYMRPNRCKLTAGELKEQIILKLLKNRKFTHVIIVDDDQRGCISLVAKKNNWTMLKAISGS